MSLRHFSFVFLLMLFFRTESLCSLFFFSFIINFLDIYYYIGKFFMSFSARDIFTPLLFFDHYSELSLFFSPNFFLFFLFFDWLIVGERIKNTGVFNIIKSLGNCYSYVPAGTLFFHFLTLSIYRTDRKLSSGVMYKNFSWDCLTSGHKN